MVGMVSGRSALVALLAVVLSAAAGAATSSAGPPGFAPGAPGVGDAYFPHDGNGGYHARHYHLQLSYEPATDRVDGVATMRAVATQGLSRFNLDLDGLRVRSVRVDGRKADWDRRAGELVVNPAGRGIRRGHHFVTEVSYAGVPRLLRQPSFGSNGVFHTDDGMVVAGQPHGASTWFPVNDHPSDKATYTFEVTVPRGLEVVANGTLAGRARDGSSTTWTWKARDAMASYLATVDIGDFDLRRYRRGGVRYVDAIDPTLFEPVAVPRTGDRFALSQRADSSYKRLTRTVRVPAGGGRLSFWVNRQTEQDWDFFLVEAHPAGSTDWTTLPDRNGHTRRDTGSSCPAWLALHPFLERYQAPTRDGGCRARGTTGVWHAATGNSDGYEHWVVNLDRYAGSTVRVSLSQVSDDTLQLYGAYVDDISVPGGAGSTSFEDDGDLMDGWRVTGAPAGSPGNRNDWRVGSAVDTPRPAGAVALRALGRQPEVIRFLSRRFGPYPFNDAGGIVDAEDRLQFALETQTRPVYSTIFFVSPRFASDVVVHELAHQWYGNSVRVHRWRDIWLNEGLATYAEWLWSKHEGGPGPGRIFRSTYRAIPANSPFWKVRVADPGPDHIFDAAIYFRGAMTVQRLRERVGDRDFSRILRRWPEVNGGGTGSTREFRRLAERTSGEQLDRLFRVWLHTDRKPVLPGSGAQRPVPRLSAPGATLSRLRAATGR